jgi:predicted alpha/beta-fold hydrolase
VSRDRFNNTALGIPGDRGGKIANQFIQQENASDRLAVLYPGMRYSCDRPLMYYATEILLNRGYDVLQMWSNYGTAEFDQLSQSEKTIQLISDGQALLKAGQQAGSYKQTLLCGKSLGTLTMAFILNQHQHLDQATTIWFTPLIHLPPVAQAIQEIHGPVFVAGSQADPTFSAGSLDQIKSNPNVRVFATDGADHSLEIPADPNQSLQILTQVMAELSAFIR